MPENPGLGKVQRLDVAEVSADVQDAIQSMDEIQNGLDDLTEKASLEILVVEQKYNKLRKPYYEKRANLIEKIPSFWGTVFANHPQVSAVVTESDTPALAFLRSLSVEEFEDIKSGYKITFEFAKENPYFENGVLVKEFQLGDEGGDSKSTQILWKPGKSLVTKGNKAKAGSKRPAEELQAAASFFEWFEEVAEDGVCEIGEAIKDEIWPNPLQFYLNDINDSVDDDDFDEEEDDGEEEEDEVGEEEVGEDEEEEEEDGKE